MTNFGFCHFEQNALAQSENPYYHFKPFAKRRPNGLQGASHSKKIHTATLSYWAIFSCHIERMRNIHKEILRHTLHLWILCFLAKAQYDNVKCFWILRLKPQYDKEYNASLRQRKQCFITTKQNDKALWQVKSLINFRILTKIYALIVLAKNHSFITFSFPLCFYIPSSFFTFF